MLVGGIQAQEQYPYERFTPYADLSSSALIDATALGYWESSWNDVGNAVIEYLAFDELSSLQQGAIQSLGMDEDSWNCYIVS